MLNEFYTLNKHLYPELTKEHFITICKMPFTQTKEIMKEGNLEEIRIKRLGTFKVFTGTTRHLRIKNERSLAKGLINEKEYNRVLTMINRFENGIQKKS